MATMTIDSDSLTDIADSIREKLGVETTYLPSEMAAAIDSITGGGGEAEYILVEWIQSDGTQAIDTGEKLTAQSEIYADASGVQESGKYLWLCGVQPDQSQGKYIGIQYAYNTVALHKMQTLDTSGSWTNKRIEFSITPSVMRMTPWNSSGASSSSGTMTASTETIPVFGIKRYVDGAYGISRLMQATLYKFSINGKDFYPCKRISDGAYGLYNTTDKTFHGDVMGGNPFMAGEEIGPIGGGGGGDASSLPDGYISLNKMVPNDVDPNKNQAHIDTGITANQDTRIVLDVDVKAEAWSGVAGIIEGTESRLGLVFFGAGDEGNNAYTIRTYFGSETIQNTSVPQGSVKSDGWVRCEIGKTMKFNGASVTHSDASFQTSGTIYLFGMDNSPNDEVGWCSGTVGIRRCKIYDGDSLIADLIPCINQSNTVGMYDIVRETFIGKSGSGSVSTAIRYEWNQDE